MTTRRPYASHFGLSRVNPTRIYRGKALVKRYVGFLGIGEYEGSPIDMVIGDCLADIFHYADAMQCNVSAVIETALMNYEAEREEDIEAELETSSGEQSTPDVTIPPTQDKSKR